jgi:beta-N-acetylhexosaminidase
VLPPAAAYGRLYQRDAEAALRSARLAARLTAADLAALGINTDCARCWMFPCPAATTSSATAPTGRRRIRCSAGAAVAEGFMAGGVLPVIKHIPGHGRATKDSHHDCRSSPRAGDLEATTSRRSARSPTCRRR